jgi:hypothetical protein
MDDGRMYEVRFTIYDWEAGMIFTETKEDKTGLQVDYFGSLVYTGI